MNIETSQSFNILDNGGYPFRVIVSTMKPNVHKCDIYRQKELDISDPKVTIEDWLFEEREYENKPFFSCQCQELLSGNSFPNRVRTSWDKSYGPRFNGNTVLIKLQSSTLKYLFIGGPIVYFFFPKENITQFESPVGLSGVPYPWAIDLEKNVYLLAYQEVGKLTTEMQSAIVNGEDPYMFYDELKRTPLEAEIIIKR